VQLAKTGACRCAGVSRPAATCRSKMATSSRRASSAVPRAARALVADCDRCRCRATTSKAPRPQLGHHRARELGGLVGAGVERPGCAACRRGPSSGPPPLPRAQHGALVERTDRTNDMRLYVGVGWQRSFLLLSFLLLQLSRVAAYPVHGRAMLIQAVMQHEQVEAGSRRRRRADTQQTTKIAANSRTGWRG